MHKILTILWLLFLTANSTGAKVKYPGPKVYAYRYYLCDKQGGTHSLDRPSRFLSHQSLERRRRQGLQVDSTDLPVPESIVKRFRVKGANVLGTSRWNNTILVSSEDTTLLNRLSLQDCVKEARMVFASPDSIDKLYNHPFPNYHDYYNRWDSLRGDPLGMARVQMEIVGGDLLYEKNLRGNGMTIAILDGGFLNANRLSCFSQTDIEGTHDFIAIHKLRKHYNSEEDFFNGIDHGTRVFSALAAESEEVMVGAAPDAKFWLLKCEDPETEMPIEEDYWAMAAEFADSVGADVINSSLGYNTYDAPFRSYELNDLDGQTALISRTASMMAGKGIVLCNSAGNSGMGTWKKITVPADASDILTVGAINQKGRNAAFSSVGPTQDGRVKPDIVAIGNGTALISGRGTLVHDMGTSFATPTISGLVACLWQGLRHKTAYEIIDMVRHSASLYSTPNNIYGYGIPNFWKAYSAEKEKGEKQ